MADADLNGADADLNEADADLSGADADLSGADANLNVVIDMADHNIWFRNFGKTNTTWSQAGFNGDSIVDMTDCDTWFDHYGDWQGEGYSVGLPEPSALAVICTGVFFAIRRRGRVRR
ncbi:MAG: hypothetical protein ACE15C_11735 [Phycisphaerae bacterium]